MITTNRQLSMVELRNILKLLNMFNIKRIQTEILWQMLNMSEFNNLKIKQLIKQELKLRNYKL